MSKRAVIGYWLLILLPAAVICGYAWQMLAQTGARLESAARQTVQRQMATIADGVQLAVTGVEDELLAALADLAHQDPLPVLQTWEDENPLVRNIFLWQPPDRLIYPPPPPGATQEEERFQRRYASLFNGRTPWPVHRSDSLPEKADGMTLTDTALGAAPTPQSSLARPKAQTTESGRQAVVKLARSSRQATPAPAAEPAITDPGHPRGVSSRATSGWLPWFTENRLHLLGWFRGTPDGPVYGLELELMALLSRLLPDFGGPTALTGTIALMDDQGRIWHQVGPADLTQAPAPALAVSLSPALPHWQIAWYGDGSGAGAGLNQQGVMLMGGLLLAIFAVAILMGTLLLTRQARRHWQDARRKTSFVSNVSHELKTPLTSIRMYAELLESNRVSDPAKQTRYLDIIARESRRLARLVDNVLDFARLEQGRKEYQLEPIDLVIFLKDFIVAQQLRLEEAGFTVIIEKPDYPVTVPADRDALNQITLNLLDNALKYAADGLKLEVAVEVAGQRALVRFLDRGPGIPAHQQRKIFEKFHRVDSSLTARNAGSGLGLSIARGLARGMGGDLTYRPGENGGSCFELSLPVTR